MNEKNLKDFCKQVRIDVLSMIHNAKSGHPGGCLSCVELLSVLYTKIMKTCPKWTNDPNFKDRDRFILSKGHASATLYSILAHLGYFPTDTLLTFRQLGSILQGHPSSVLTPGVEVSTGSLGQGLSIACGIALALKLDKTDCYVFVLMGDGELQEGSVWEGVMNASHHNLDNLIAIIDRNKLQIDGCTENVKSLEPIDEKFKAFGWDVIKINGHDFDEIFNAFKKAKTYSRSTAIIADTIKGYGVSFMANEKGWHGKAPNKEQLDKAIGELQC